MNIKSNEWTLVKMWLAFDPAMSSGTIAKRLREFRIRYGV